MRCHRMHEYFVLGKIRVYKCFFLWIFPLKAARAARIVLRLYNVHAVSYFAVGVNDTACSVHAVSMTLQKFKFLCELEFIFEKALTP
jgi:hypothetical protein